MSQFQPKDFAEQLSLLAHKREAAASRLEFLKWVVLTAGAIGSFVLIDYQQERRANDVERTQLKISLFENYIGENDDDNLLLWERKLRKLEAFIGNDTSLLDFVSKERAQLNDLKKKEEEALRLAEETRRIDQQLASLSNSANPTLPEDVDLTHPETLTPILTSPGADPLPEATQESIKEYNDLVSRRLEYTQKLDVIAQDFKNSGVDLRVNERATRVSPAAFAE